MALLAIAEPASAACLLQPNGQILCDAAGTHGTAGADDLVPGGVGGDGTAGGAGTTIDEIVDGAAETTADGTAGVFVDSSGGDGGAGGDGGVGGSGGAGGAGGAAGGITLQNSADVTTSGQNSAAILARSNGGAGGAPGSADGLILGLVTHGEAGAGGAAGAISVINTGGLTATGNLSDGVRAESLGGVPGAAPGIPAGPIDAMAGGDVSVVNQGDIVTSGATAAGLHGLSRGGPGQDFRPPDGHGGGGAGAGHVSLGNTGAIASTGDSAVGMFAESEGGAGGDGMSASDFFSAHGSAGGSGGAAGAVTLAVDGTVAAAGDAAAAVVGFSTGGTGGDGGDGRALGSGTGGDGGAGGAAGAVSATIGGDVTADGDDARGVRLYSLGGTGGAGGKGGAIDADGGTGGAGGAGGAVTVDIAEDASIGTTGLGAHALVAESRGGDGGLGGDASGLVGEGAGGGAGGVGGAVSVINSGSLGTAGDYAYAVHALSVGGGGGGGGGGAGLVGLSAQGGGGSRGGAVDVVNNGSVASFGEGSHAVFVQSIGGGGGAAGAAAGLAAVGGGGSQEAADQCENDPSRLLCNDGGDVSILNNGVIGTSGAAARGVFAQSIGGGGGDGGAATGLFSFGGFGGEGGNGGAVSLVNNGEISTTGEFADAVFLESLGGGGGTGGDATSAAVGVGMAIGGSGGLGGDGSLVTLTNNAALSTEGYRSSAIYAQSVGGGGGRGGDAFVAGVSALSATLGGSGGGGGQGGRVDIVNAGSIATADDRSRGVFAQSVGGGGGDGGAAFSLGVSPILSMSAAIGGRGGDGGDGGAVTMSNSGSIFTDGDDSQAVFVQSVGGGGGVGGSASSQAFSIGDKVSVSVAFSLGGSGGGGGDGGAVEADNEGEILTLGDASHGVQAQSVGGGGGVGGDASATAVSLTATGASASISVAVGGSGGAGGDGAAATLRNSGEITTAGVRSYGAFVQSVGGGGGDGGAGGASAPELNARKGAVVNFIQKQEIKRLGSSRLQRIWKDVDPSRAGNKNIEIGVAVGGSGGAAGDGGPVVMENEGGIETNGYLAYGIFAQSVGGGGGVGAAGVGTATTIPLTASTFGAGVGVGGSGGAAGDGGSVDVGNSGLLVTHGHDAHALFAQSVGGGGGVGDIGSADAGITGVEFTLGGQGGAAGDGGVVTVEHSGQIETSGNRAFGLFAQSIGGGGGMAGAGESSYSASVAVGGNGGVAGDGGDVTVDLDGDIVTRGAAAFGIAAQSVGGGGGIGGDVVAGSLSVFAEESPFNILGFNIGGSGTNGGNGGTIDIVSVGDIETSGAAAHGIFAQSVGGGGGIQGSPVEKFGAANLIGSQGGIGAGGDVTVAHTGNILATGESAHGIFAQTAGDDGAGGSITYKVTPFGLLIPVDMNVPIEPVEPGDISVAVDGGTVRGGTGDAFGIFLDGGGQNTVTVGADAQVTSLAFQAIRATGGNDVVANAGVVEGNVDLGGGVNSFDNLAGATFATGEIVDLGAGGILTNDGVLSVLGGRPAAGVTITGDLTQNAGGALHVDIDGAAHDRLDVSGAVSLAGDLKVSLVNLTTTGTFRLVDADGGVVDNGLGVASTVTVDYSLSFTPNALDLSVAADFMPDSLPSGVTSVGAYLNAALANGGGGMGDLLAVLGGVTDVGAYTQLLQGLRPEHLASAKGAALSSAGGFAQNLMSCRTVVSPGDEGQCVWSRVDFQKSSQDATPSNRRFDEDIERVSMGGQWIIGPDWRAGVAFAAEDGEAHTAGYSSAELTRYHIGASIKRLDGPWLWAAALSGGWSESDVTRTLPAALGGAVARSTLESAWGNVRLRAARTFETGGWYLRPIVDVDATLLHESGSRETGAGALNLVVPGNDDVFVTITPSVEFGGAFTTPDRSLRFRPYGVLGAAIATAGETRTRAGLQGAGGLAPFDTAAEMDSVSLVVSAGVHAFSQGGVDFRVGYDGRFGEHGESNAITARIGWQF